MATPRLSHDPGARRPTANMQHEPRPAGGAALVLFFLVVFAPASS